MSFKDYEINTVVKGVTVVTSPLFSEFDVNYCSKILSNCTEILVKHFGDEIKNEHIINGQNMSNNDMIKNIALLSSDCKNSFRSILSEIMHSHYLPKVDKYSSELILILNSGRVSETNTPLIYDILFLEREIGWENLQNL